jgi:hypothetical protein
MNPDAASPADDSDDSASVITTDPADAPALSQVIADAFHDLPQSHWLVADAAIRREIFPGYFRLFVEHALASGIVYTTADRCAVAMWLPAGEEAAAPPDGYEERLAAVTGPRLERLYLRHGYAGRADGPFRFPDGGPPMWPMWREPQPPAAG